MRIFSISILFKGQEACVSGVIELIHPIVKVEANDGNVMKMAQNVDSTHQRRLLSEENKVMQPESTLKIDTTSKIENKERASPKESNDHNDLNKKSTNIIKNIYKNLCIMNIKNVCEKDHVFVFLKTKLKLILNFGPNIVKRNI